MAREFGYTILKDETTDLDRSDGRMARYLLLYEPSVASCIGCGSCTATCSSGHFTNFNIRLLHTRVRRGETTRIRQEIAACMFCGKCQMVCPRGVNLRNVILTLNRALEHL